MLPIHTRECQEKTQVHDEFVSSSKSLMRLKNKVRRFWDAAMTLWEDHEQSGD
jgi:hypothetical protein